MSSQDRKDMHREVANAVATGQVDSKNADKEANAAGTGRGLPAPTFAPAPALTKTGPCNNRWSSETVTLPLVPPLPGPPLVPVAMTRAC